MGIRFEKDTILNWINEMGKFLRLLDDKWENPMEEHTSLDDVSEGYRIFFKKDRASIITMSNAELELFVASLEPEQIRPLAQLLMYDGLIYREVVLLEKAKLLFELHMHQSGSFAFEDYEFLGRIDKAINEYRAL